MYFFLTMADYKNSKYLLYSKFETKSDYGSVVAGSLLIGCADTVEEATQKLALSAQKSNEFLRQCPSSDKQTFVYIENRPEWWNSTLV